MYIYLYNRITSGGVKSFDSRASSWLVLTYGQCIFATVYASISHLTRRIAHSAEVSANIPKEDVRLWQRTYIKLLGYLLT